MVRDKVSKAEDEGMPTIPIEDVSAGIMACIEGEVIRVRQTTGPTLFTVGDDTGAITCAAFDGAGVRAYPEVHEKSLVRAMGKVEMRNGAPQIAVRSMSLLTEERAEKLKARLDEAAHVRTTLRKVELLVDSTSMRELYDSMYEVARRLLECVSTSTPIIIRHHADADGITAAVCLERSVLPLIQKMRGHEGARYLLRRLPSRTPFYEMSDVMRDIESALDASERFGHGLPRVVLVDNGSGQEDVEALRLLGTYGIPAIVVDHHQPYPDIDGLVQVHVNPAHVGADYNITTGMLCLEIARMVGSAADDLVHLAAVSALGDRARGYEAERYLELACSRYPLEHLRDMALSLDFLSYWMRFSEQSHLISDVLDLSSAPRRHAALVKQLSTRAKQMIAAQLACALPHTKTLHLPNGILLAVLDMDKYIHTFTFPPAGKSVGEVHDHICAAHEEEPVITIGHARDFAVIRSRGVHMDFPAIVSELSTQLEGAGISGGGHLVVGSMRFIQGMRKEVLKALVERFGRIEMEG